MAEHTGVPDSPCIDLRKVRDELQVTQKELAALLGVSLRAVQSYEQSLRATPPHVQKMAILLLYLQHRAAPPEQQPCWDVRDCPSRARGDCPAVCLHAGDLCWLITASCVDGQEAGSWEAKWEYCRECQVVTRFMPRSITGGS